MSFFSAAGKLLEKAAVQLDKAAVSLDHAFDLPSHQVPAQPPQAHPTNSSSESPSQPPLLDPDLGILWHNPVTQPQQPQLQHRTSTPTSAAPSLASASGSPARDISARDTTSRLERRLGGLFRSESHIAPTTAANANQVSILAASASPPRTTPAEPIATQAQSRASLRTPSLSASSVCPENIPLPPSPILAPTQVIDSRPRDSGHLNATDQSPPQPPTTTEQESNRSAQAPQDQALAARQLIRSLLAKVQARDATIAQLQAENAALAAQREQDRQAEGAAINAELKRNQALHTQLDEAHATVHSLSTRLSDTLAQWESNRRDFEARIALLQSELDAARRSANLGAAASGPLLVPSLPSGTPDPLAADLQQAVSFWANKCGELERQLVASQSLIYSLEAKLQTRVPASPPVPPATTAPVSSSLAAPESDSDVNNASLVQTLRQQIQDLEQELERQQRRQQQQANSARQTEPVTTSAASLRSTSQVIPALPASTAPTSSLQTQMDTMRAVKEQLATQVMQLSRELAQLRTQHAELGAREDTLLELLGEREAEVQDLKEMLLDAKEAYKMQLESLMEAVGKNH